MTGPISDRRPDPVQPRTRSREIDRKNVDDRDDEFETTLANQGDEGDGTRAAQDMLAQGSVVQAMPVRIASFDPPVGLEVGTESPLEQAVQALLDQMQSVIADITNTAASTSQRVATITLDDLDDSAEESFLPEGIAQPDSKHAGGAAAAKGPVATVGVREPEPLPENDNPSHMHLVLDDGDQRIVVTVAVRGDQVNATVRGDDQTAAALARNAASLDHALHTKGLDLQSFTAERDLARDQRQQEQTERDEAPSEEFRMEKLI